MRSLTPRTSQLLRFFYEEAAPQWNYTSNIISHASCDRQAESLQQRAVKAPHGYTSFARYLEQVRPQAFALATLPLTLNTDLHHQNYDQRQIFNQRTMCVLILRGGMTLNIIDLMWVLLVHCFLKRP